MRKPPDFIHMSKPDRTEIGQFNKSATKAFLDWFDATLARDKRRFPKGCGFAWFLLEQMLQTYLERYPRHWEHGDEQVGAHIDQGRLVLALMDDQTRRQRLHPLSTSLWQQVQSYRAEHQPDMSLFAIVEQLISKGLSSSAS